MNYAGPLIQDKTRKTSPAKVREQGPDTFVTVQISKKAFFPKSKSPLTLVINTILAKL